MRDRSAAEGAAHAAPSHRSVVAESNATGPGGGESADSDSEGVAAPVSPTTSVTTRVYLSPPSVTEREVELVAAAMRSGWVAPVGPDLTAFEDDICAFTGVGNAVALASGTAAIHLGLKALGVRPGDEVVVPTLTFGATAFAVVHAGAVPVFLDSEERTWNLDPQLLAEFLARRAAESRLPAAIITVDLFGRMCDYGAINGIAEGYGIPVLEDAAEALGSTQGSRAAGSFGRVGVFSFNGNKIMTTSGGGMLVTDDAAIADKVRFWSTQSREDLPWYEHNEIGFNYRMSNILAALGRGQLERLPAMIGRRREINALYRAELSGVAAVEVLADDPWGRSNMWLTTVRFGGHRGPKTAIEVREELATRGIESRPVWKPMHQQPVFAGAESHLSGAADRIFADGLCLPSGVDMSDADVREVVGVIAGNLS